MLGIAIAFPSIFLTNIFRLFCIFQTSVKQHP